MKKTYLLTIFSLLLATNKLFAANVQPEKNFDISTPQQQEIQGKVPEIASSTEDAQSIHMTADELIAQPKLLTRVLDSQLMLGHVDNVAFLLPLYQKTENPDPLLIC